MRPSRPIDLATRSAAFPPPTLVDVRRQPAFDDDPRRHPGRDTAPPEALDDVGRRVEPWRPVVVYCVRGHEVSQNAAAVCSCARLRGALSAGGLDAGAPKAIRRSRFAAPTRWVTRERPKIDRIACPWLDPPFHRSRARNSSTCRTPTCARSRPRMAPPRTTFRTSTTRTSDRNAASMRSSAGTRSPIRRSTSSRPSFAPPTRRRSTSRRRRRAARGVARTLARCSPTTMRC